MINELNAGLQALPPEVRLYGVILFTESHPNVIKALKDTEYYNALHTLSGDRLAVFATMAFPGHWGFPDFSPGTMGMMRQVWKEPRANLELLITFGLPDSRKLPVLVLFSFEGDEMRYHTHSFDASTPLKVFDSLAAIFTSICAADDPDFAVAKRTLKWATTKARLAKVIDILGTLRGAAGV